MNRLLKYNTTKYHESGTIPTSTGDASQEDSTDQPLWGPKDINQDQMFHYLSLTDKTLSYGTTNNFNPHVSYKSLGKISGTTDKHNALHFC